MLAVLVVNDKDKLHSEANGFFFYLKLMKSSDVHDLSWSHCFYDLLVVFGLL